MNFLKAFGIVLTAAALLTLCACSSGQPAQTTQPVQNSGNIQTTASLPTVTNPSDVDVISYDAHYDEDDEVFMYSVSTLGEPSIDASGLRQDDGKGATLVTSVGEIAADATGAELLEEKIDRSKNILAEFGEAKFAFYESSDNGKNVCYFGIIGENGKTVNMEMTFPTDERDTYFQHVSMLVQIYMDVYATPAAAK